MGMCNLPAQMSCWPTNRSVPICYLSLRSAQTTHLPPPDLPHLQEQRFENRLQGLRLRSESARPRLQKKELRGYLGMLTNIHAH